MLKASFPVIAPLFIIIASLIATVTAISLLTSYYIYDYTKLYTLDWLDPYLNNQYDRAVNINAGFDETSYLLKHKFKPNEFLVFDFYDPKLHTEISIKRARKAYPSFPQTVEIATNKIPIAENSVDIIFLIFAAHEIRNELERIIFFNELKRCLKSNGKIIVVEHLRDTFNFLAYNIGFLHFHSRNSWVKTFNKSGLFIQNEIKFTPFLTTFILTKNGTAY